MRRGTSSVSVSSTTHQPASNESYLKVGKNMDGKAGKISPLEIEIIRFPQRATTFLATGTLPPYQHTT